MALDLLLDKKSILKAKIKDKLSTIMLECSLIKTELKEENDMEEDIRNIEQATEEMGDLLDSLVVA